MAARLGRFGVTLMVPIPVKAGEQARFAIKADGMQFFDPDAGAAIWT